MTMSPAFQALVTRRRVLGGLGFAGALAFASPTRVGAEHGAVTESVRSDPWLAVNLYDGSVFLTWVAPERTADEHSGAERATPTADATALMLRRSTGSTSLDLPITA